MELKAGAAVRDITPGDSQFLFGYPHVERYSTGVKNPLLSSALYLDNGHNNMMFISNDIIFIDKELSRRARERISLSTGVERESIMISATHTHSGPITVNYLSNLEDPIVPKADPAYLAVLEDGIVEAGIEAWKNVKPASAGLAVADGKGVGTNRRDPDGPADPEIPVLLVKDEVSSEYIACMLVYSMHPTVLHEDSTLVSGDFPSFTREYLQQNILGKNCPVLYNTGPEGNQSPRHVTSANTFAEAERLGIMLAKRVEKVIGKIEYSSSLVLGVQQGFINPPLRRMVSLSSAERHLVESVKRLKNLQESGASSREVRTAECDWFGTEETVTIARMADKGLLEKYAAGCLPAEVQVFKVGDWYFAAWPGEVFVEYALAAKKKHKNIFIINLANGEFQGYIVTPEAAAEGGYEASNALFEPETGGMLVEETLRLLEKTKQS